jgi:hypothetical protein
VPLQIPSPLAVPPSSQASNSPFSSQSHTRPCPHPVPPPDEHTEEDPSDFFAHHPIRPTQSPPAPNIYPQSLFQAPVVHTSFQLRPIVPSSQVSPGHPLLPISVHSSQQSVSYGHASQPISVNSSQTANTTPHRRPIAPPPFARVSRQLIEHPPPSPASHISLTDSSIPPSPTSTVDLCYTTQDEGTLAPQTPAATGKGKRKTKGSESPDKAQDSNTSVAPPPAKKAKSKGKAKEKPALTVEELEEATIHPLPTSASASEPVVRSARLSKDDKYFILSTFFDVETYEANIQWKGTFIQEVCCMRIHTYYMYSINLLTLHFRLKQVKSLVATGHLNKSPITFKL